MKTEIRCARKRLCWVLLALVMMLCINPLQGQLANEDIRQSQIANRWIEAFGELDPRNNISIVLASYDISYELQGVVSMTYGKHFIVVTYRKGSGLYKALIYPSTILIIKETPKA
ncbi:MAG: hypothetical protein ACPGN3_08025 [Opitutales bacterium]